MTKEQSKKILYELQEVEPEQLKGESKKLFEAIMKIADERDELKEELEMLKDIKEIAESKVGELSPIRIKKNKSVIKQTMSQIERRSRAER